MNSAEETTLSGDGLDSEITELEVELPNLLLSVLERIELLFRNQDGGVNSNSMLCQITVLDQVVSFLRAVVENDEVDRHNWVPLAEVFSELLGIVKLHHLELLERPTIISRLNCEVTRTSEPGRPSFNISTEMLEDLKGYGFSWAKIAQILGVSRWTIDRRVKDMGLTNLGQFTLISDNELDALVSSYINRHGG